MAGENLLKMAEQKFQGAAEKIAKDMIATCYKEPQTNADRIRAMSDEELANFMADRNVNESTLQLINKDHALTAVQIEALRHRIYCACMQWLKQPAVGE